MMQRSNEHEKRSAEKDLKELAKRRKMNLAAQSFIETLHFAVPILRFFKWLASAATSFVH
nr:hypothetical protein [Bacillus velezensis]